MLGAQAPDEKPSRRPANVALQLTSGWEQLCRRPPASRPRIIVVRPRRLAAELEALGGQNYRGLRESADGSRRNRGGRRRGRMADRLPGRNGARLAVSA